MAACLSLLTLTLVPLPRVKSRFLRSASYAAKLEGQKVKVFVDNIGVSRILKVSSSKPHLQKVSVDIFRLCFALGISLDSQWLSREENARADLLSRFIDMDDWSLNPAVFRFWMPDRVLIPWIVFHLTSIRKLLDFIRSIFRRVAPRLMLWPRIGVQIIIGYVRQCILSSLQLSICAVTRGLAPS